MLTVIIAAGGNSSRMENTSSKVFAGLCGTPAIIHTLSPLKTIRNMNRIIVAVRPADKKKCRAILDEFGWEGVSVVSGGKSRAETVRHAIPHIPDDTSVIAVHDAARPCASKELWNKVLKEARAHGAAIPALPVTDTLKKASGGFIESTVPREGLFLVQTPQAFDAQTFRAAYKKTAEIYSSVTDDASLMEAAGVKVSIVPGERTNIKITYDADILMAECILLSRG